MATTFHASIVTPERTVFSGEVTFVAFPAFDGEMGILAHRAPLLAKLGTGELRVEAPSGARSLFVDGGFAQMVENRLTILTEVARDVGDLDRAAAERELEAARSMPVRDDASFAARQHAERRARAQIAQASGR